MTTIGPIYLNVSDLDRLVPFYEDHLGLQVQQRDGDTVSLGTGGADLLVLTERPEGKTGRGTTGLYHFAILVPSRLDLAKSLKRLAETRTPVQGFADHLVSEAIYLPDPDGNGIEIYRDRPRDTWAYDGSQIRMSTEPLDVDGLLRELAGQDTTWHGLPQETVIGHIHLHVADIDKAKRFYCDLLGFDRMLHWGSALFVSHAGYHHHIGLNTWAGVGAPPPPADALGLDRYVIRLSADVLDAAVLRLRQAGITVSENDGMYTVQDPSQNRIVLARE